MKKYRKKPLVIEAVQWDGKKETAGMLSYLSNGKIYTDYPLKSGDGIPMFIDTLEGQMQANEGDYIIKGINDEFYPCRADIFEASYEEI